MDNLQKKFSYYFHKDMIERFDATFLLAIGVDEQSVNNYVSESIKKLKEKYEIEDIQRINDRI